MGVGNREFYFCLFLSIGRLTVSLIFRFLWRYVGGMLDVYKWTGKNDYVALCEPEYPSFSGGCVIFIYFVKLWNYILLVTGTVGMDYTSTIRSSTVFGSLPYIRERTALFTGYEEG
jgi:hypothetical protein